MISATATILAAVLNERDRALDEVRRSRDDLDKRIAERTEELVSANAELRREAIERWYAEEALRESEERYRNFFATSQDGVFMTSQDGQFIDVNAAALKMLGYSPGEREEALLKSVTDFYANPEERAAHVALVSELGLSKEYPVDLRKADGTILATLVTTVPRRDSKGTIIGFQGSIRDITERKRSEEILRNTVQRFHTILSSLYSGVLIVTEEGTIEFANQAFCDMFDLTESPASLNGLTASEMLERMFGVYADPGNTLGRITEIVANQLPVKGEEVAIRGDRTYLVDFVPLRVNGKSCGRLWHHTDITERKMTEERVNEMARRAEAASAAKSEFLANMSHEIRTPLNAVLGMLDLTLDSNLDEKQRERVLVAKSAADALLALLNDILDFSKIEAGKLDLVETDFSVRSLLHNTESLLDVWAQDKMLNLTSSVDANVPVAVRGDPNRLRQILLNLGYNAVKFTDHGAIAILVDVHEQMPDEVLLHFAVSDTGIGLPPHKVNSIFDRFSQADSSATRKYGGSGLGLAISSQLVAAMGGYLWVESEAGKGSTFHFTVRFRQAESADPMTPENRQDTAAKVDLAGMKVLLVEDNIFNQAVAVEVLKKQGCKVTVASNGREAVEAFHAQTFDVILMDLQMPEMDGFEATRIIRSGETSDRIPIIAQTAHAFTEDRDRCMKAGMDEHISKPINVTELLRILARFRRSRGHAGRAAGLSSYGLDYRECPRSDADAFDNNALLERLGGDEEALKEILDLFCEQIPGMLKDLCAAVQAEDWERLASLSHSLKGASWNLGAHALADLAAELERNAQAPDPAGLHSLLSRMELELSAVRKRASQLGS